LKFLDVIPVFLGLRILISIGHFAILLFALLNFAAYGSPAAALCFAVAFWFTVTNLRRIFPWPLKRSELPESPAIVVSSLWAGLFVGCLSAAAGLLGIPILKDWWIAFAILALTCVLNLLLLRAEPQVTSESPGTSP
jgi:hypothetical protein